MSECATPKPDTSDEYNQDWKGNRQFDCSQVTDCLGAGPGLDFDPATGTFSLEPGTQIGQILVWNGTSWILLDAGNAGEVLTIVGGTPDWEPLLTGSRDKYVFTEPAIGEDEFTVSGTFPTATNLDVFRNGQLLNYIEDYTYSAGTGTITLNTPILTDEEVIILISYT